MEDEVVVESATPHGHKKSSSVISAARPVGTSLRTRSVTYETQSVGGYGRRHQQ